MHVSWERVYSFIKFSNHLVSLSQILVQVKILYSKSQTGGFFSAFQCLKNCRPQSLPSPTPFSKVTLPQNNVILNSSLGSSGPFAHNIITPALQFKNPTNSFIPEILIIAFDAYSQVYIHSIEQLLPFFHR